MNNGVLFVDIWDSFKRNNLDFPLDDFKKFINGVIKEAKLGLQAESNFSNLETYKKFIQHCKSRYTSLFNLISKSDIDENKLQTLIPIIFNIYLSGTILEVEEFLRDIKIFLRNNIDENNNTLCKILLTTLDKEKEKVKEKVKNDSIEQENKENLNEFIFRQALMRGNQELVREYSEGDFKIPLDLLQEEAGKLDKQKSDNSFSYSDDEESSSEDNPMGNETDSKSEFNINKLCVALCLSDQSINKEILPDIAELKNKAKFRLKNTRVELLDLADLSRTKDKVFFKEVLKNTLPLTEDFDLDVEDKINFLTSINFDENYKDIIPMMEQDFYCDLLRYAIAEEKETTIDQVSKEEVSDDQKELLIEVFIERFQVIPDSDYDSDSDSDYSDSDNENDTEDENDKLNKKIIEKYSTFLKLVDKISDKELKAQTIKKIMIYAIHNKIDMNLLFQAVHQQKQELKYFILQEAKHPSVCFSIIAKYSIEKFQDYLKDVNQDRNFTLTPENLKDNNVFFLLKKATETRLQQIGSLYEMRANSKSEFFTHPSNELEEKYKKMALGLKLNMLFIEKIFKITDITFEEDKAKLSAKFLEFFENELTARKTSFYYAQQLKVDVMPLFVDLYEKILMGDDKIKFKKILEAEFPKENYERFLRKLPKEDIKPMQPMQPMQPTPDIEMEVQVQEPRLDSSDATDRAILPESQSQDTSMEEDDNSFLDAFFVQEPEDLDTLLKEPIINLNDEDYIKQIETIEVVQEMVSEKDQVPEKGQEMGPEMVLFSNPSTKRQIGEIYSNSPGSQVSSLPKAKKFKENKKGPSNFHSGSK